MANLLNEDRILQEWLVSDGRGGFAMGTPSGLRLRKYHGFYLGIAGRGETCYLADLEFGVSGLRLWPHVYAGPGGAVIDPDPSREGLAPAYELTRQGPSWRWALPGGKLTFSVEAHPPGGIRLSWKWQAAARKGAAALEPPGGGPTAPVLNVRPFWALRPLHGIGGEQWNQRLDPAEGRGTVTALSGQAAHFLAGRSFEWRDEPYWYRHFHYPEEERRGYQSVENLYSAGVFDVRLRSNAGFALVVSDDAADLRAEAEPAVRLTGLRRRPAALDFVLARPAGITAGFPWFGEWGRDTFVSLPGIVAAWLGSGADPEEVWDWAEEVLARWSQWIELTGMVPNLIEKGGSHQWESSDATLWWCHGLAALWQLSLTETRREAIPRRLEERFGPLLKLAIDSIRSGRHLFLRADSEGLLEVTEPHTTWMDARIDGAAVTPRTGRLPEINALWAQALCLDWIWARGEDPSGIERLARRALDCKERGRPNTVFLHSVPLAPSFLLMDWKSAAQDLEEIFGELWTPVGLRTLTPKSPAYRPVCAGPQAERDRAYHQGPAWPWLGGHFEMAKERLAVVSHEKPRLASGGFAQTGGSAEAETPIPGHVPEIYDAEPPYIPRGTPAQAWSVACFEEAQARRRTRADAKLTRILAQRWMDRKDRQPRARGEVQAG